MTNKEVDISKTNLKVPLPEVSGNKQKDLQVFRKSKSIDFGIQLLEYYVPKNRRLIDYCQSVRDKKYITENLNLILNGSNY